MSDKEKRSSSLFTSLRRNVVRVAPASVVEEMRPMLTSASRPATPKSARHHHSSHTSSGILPTAATRQDSSTWNTFEFSMRDKSDASAKRGFRVEIPKRLICYTFLAFVVVPLFLFGYVEVHNHEKEAAALPDTSKTPVESTHYHHSHDKYKMHKPSIVEESSEEEAETNSTVIGENENTTMVTPAATTVTESSAVTQEDALTPADEATKATSERVANVTSSSLVDEETPTQDQVSQTAVVATTENALSTTTTSTTTNTTTSSTTNSTSSGG